MIFQTPLADPITSNEYRVYPVGRWERLRLAWAIFLDPEKFRICLRLSNAQEWMAKNCNEIPLDLRGTKTVDYS